MLVTDFKKQNPSINLTDNKWYVIRLEDNPDVFFGKENRWVVDGISAALKLKKEEAEDLLHVLKIEYGRFARQIYIDECYLNTF